MPRRPPPPTLGACIAHRRRQLRLSQAEAARRAKAARSTLIDWENDRAVPGKASRVRLAAALEWEPDSVDAVLAGRPPAPLRQTLATVIPLRPDVAEIALDADLAGLIEIWQDVMKLPQPTVRKLIEDYRADKAGADAARRERFLRRAREAGG